jgi:hypothetical protein
MKRVITYLMVLLISLPVIGQQINEGPQKFEKHNIIDAFKKHRTDNKNNYNHVISKLNEINKLAKAADEKELDSLISERWDENIIDWVKDSKEEFTYDASKNVKSYTTYNWDDNNLEWIPEYKYEFTFDSNLNISSFLASEWSSYFSQWSYVNKIDFTYVGNNLITEMVFGYLVTQWYIAYKIEYAYDGSQNMISETNIQWWPQQNLWMNSNKYEYTYDSSNNMIQELYFLWDYGSSDWYHATTKSDYGYDGSNNLISEIWSDWDGNDWVNNEKFEYTYSAGGNLISDIGSDWTLPNGPWVYVYKDTYSYDANENRTLGNYYEWLSGSNDWSIYYKDEFIFDLAYGINDIVAPILSLDFIGMSYDDTVVVFNNMVIGYRGFEYENPIWVDTDKVIFYYSNYSNPLNINDAKVSESIKLYPNPVHEVLTINSEIPLNRVEIYSLLGKKVTEVKSHFDAIQVNNLSNGIYILKIDSDKGSATRKLIKK